MYVTLLADISSCFIAGTIIEHMRHVHRFPRGIGLLQQLQLMKPLMHPSLREDLGATNQQDEGTKLSVRIRS